MDRIIDQTDKETFEVLRDKACHDLAKLYVLTTDPQERKSIDSTQGVLNSLRMWNQCIFSTDATYDTTIVSTKIKANLDELEERLPVVGEMALGDKTAVQVAVASVRSVIDICATFLVKYCSPLSVEPPASNQTD